MPNKPLYPVQTLEAGKATTLASVRLAFRTWGLQLPSSGIAFGPHYIVSRSASGVSTHERGRNITRKLQTSVLNPVLGKVFKTICLFCLFGSNVVASLSRALLVDALGETTLLGKPPHRVKVSFIEEELR